ncbi:MAG: hybrid sensor histidine kinase/response regulator [Flavobacteriales bacterium]|nr:hybrid sensor histidine kinase/response regulator [Flavobacteriales bacterium]
MSDRIGILYLDDEEQNLLSFQALFRRDYDIHTATNAPDAVQILNTQDIQIIFSDQKMPEVSGVEFFEMILHDFPHAVRILITGYADIEAVIDAINKGQVYRYVTKPWDPNELKICVENALEKFRRDKELIEKNTRLAEANAELEKFVYSASHDLRAPVASIMGVLKVAKMEGIDGKTAGYFDMIEKSTARLNEFATNIINYFQNDHSETLHEEISFDAIIDEVFDKYQRQPEYQFITFRKDVAANSTFHSDTYRIRMILNNLVSNAVKFCDNKKPQCFVDVSVVQNKEKAVVRVTDNGIGISPQVLPTIFEMLFSNSDKNVGSGVGLYIAKKATKKLGGTISASSEQGKGSRFTFEIPNKA